MSVQPAGSRSLRFQSLIGTVTNSATFRRLVGADDPADAAAFVHIDLALDDGSAPFPRAIIRNQGPQVAIREGTDTYLGMGEIAVFVQYLQFSDAQLESWYSLSAPFNEDDRRMHMNNLFGQISDEMSALATTPGCLEFQKLEEFSCGEVDFTTENAQQLVELTWVIHREGLP